MMRHRACGCDARDAMEYDQGAFPSSQLCSVCDVTPCAYVAQFACVVEHNGICLAGEGGGFAGAVPDDGWVAGDVTLRVLCEFENPCVFVSIQDATGVGVTCSPTTSCHQDICCSGLQDISHNGQACVGCTNPGACQWIHRLGSLDGVVTGWEMDISANPVQLTHTAAGVTYEADAAWDCLGANTMTLTGPFDGPLPSKVCVIPKPVELIGDGAAAKFPCGRTGLVEQNCCDDAIPCGYSDADRLACCDPCCDQLPDQPLFIACGECTESTTVTPVAGGGNGLEGVDSPSGQTYGACATLCGKEICGNWYCSAGQWKLDGYIDGVFCGTGDLTHECCPLSLGTTTLSGCSPSGCDVCVGDGCITCTDCPGTAMPSVLYASDGMTTWTLTYDAGLGYWQDTTARDGLGCTGQTAVVQCTGTGIYFALAPSGQSCYASVNTCDPFDADCTFFGCDAATYSLSITA